MKRRIDVWLVIAAGVFTVLVALIGFLIGYYFRNGYTNSQFQLFDQAYLILKQNGLKPLPENLQIEYEMIQGLLRAYNDPYTVFIAPPQHEIQTNQLEGKFGGIGAALQRDTRNIMRVYPYPDSPASEAGVPAGSILLNVDQLTVNPEVSDDLVVAALRGEVGSLVTITVQPQDSTPAAAFTIKRREFGIPSVSWQIIPEQPELAVIKITTIAATTSAEMKTAISDAQAHGASAIILDLRDNGGGLVDAGVDVARLFAKGGTTLIAQHYPNRADDVSRAIIAGPYAEIPLFIFVNQNTASAAEIIAGALQEQKRAILIGKTTFGKDTIQLVFDLTDGSSIHVTAARWSLPGNPGFTSGAGIQPDAPLTQESPTDADYIKSALELYDRLP